MSNFTCYVGEQKFENTEKRENDSAGSGRCHP